MLFGNNIYKKKINPVSIYCYVWSSVVFLYELKLIKYYPLTLTTWGVVFIMQLLYVMGCYIAKKIYHEELKATVDFEISSTHSIKSQKVILNIIIIITLISGCVILINVFQFFRMFGFNLLGQTNELYLFRLTGSEGIKTIPYLGVLVYVSLIFSAVYTVQYGFKKIFIIPMALIALEELTSGGRASLVLAPLMFVGVLLASDVKSKFSKMQVGFVLTLVGILFIVISSNRTAGIDNVYSSEFLYNITNGNPTVYKLIEYITSPLGTLNAFLKDPTFSFGKNTFLTIYNLLNKIGYNINISLYQDDFYVPMRVNVGTMLRELIEDFTIGGCALIIFFIGFCFSSSYLKFRNTLSYLYAIWVAVFFQIISFSFFDWRLRSSAEWIILVCGSVIGVYLDRKLRSYK